MPATPRATHLTVPVGTIISWSGGYFSNIGNTGYVPVVGNSIFLVNSELNKFGWHVCNGTELNDSTSPIYNGASRFLPDLTDNRFLAGAMSAGLAGGQDFFQITTNNLPSLSLGFSGSTGTSSNNSTQTVASSGHDHGSGTYEARFANSSGSANLHQLVNSPPLAGQYTTNTRNAMGTSATSVGILMNHAIDVGGESSGPSDTTTVAGTSHVASHSHSFSGTATASYANNSIDNKPRYLSVYYLIKVK